MNSKAWITIKVQCSTYQWIRLYELYKLMESFFFKFRICFELMAENWKKIKRIARREYWSKCNVLYINGFDSTCSTNWWKAFFKFRNYFWITYIFENNSGVGVYAWGRHLCWSGCVLVSFYLRHHNYAMCHYFLEQLIRAMVLVCNINEAMPQGHFFCPYTLKPA